MGTYGLDYGDVQERGRTLKLRPKEKNRRSDYWGISTELVLILWGERHYLVPAAEIVKFANAINAGREPRSATMSGEFFLRQGDDSRPAIGKPNLPAEYADYLLENPIQGKISSVQGTRAEGDTTRTTVDLDVGKAQGVKVGMQFYLQNSLWFYPAVVITSVGDSNSVAELIQTMGVSEQLYPKPGLPLSTLPAREELR